MTSATGKIFMHGRSQAVRLPKEFRLPGKEVRVSRAGKGILLEPIEVDAMAWLASIRALDDGHDFMPEGREQPPMPDGSDIDFDR